MPKHTPGPWLVTRDSRSPCAIEAKGGDGGALALVYLTDGKTRKRTPEARANALLMAGAPALAEAALQALCDYESMNAPYQNVAVVEALRKALTDAGVTL